MNIILLFENDFIRGNDKADNKQTKGKVVLTGRRCDHINNIHRAQAGQTLSVGLLNGKIGEGYIDSIDENQVTLTISLQSPPPLPLPLTLIIALPRPKMLKRILQTCATMGAKKIIFINSYRVEKSYWQSPLLSEESIREQLILGLEQGKDTQLPEVILEKRFKPFVEDRLPSICTGTHAIVAHPKSTQPCPSGLTSDTTLVIGPEGGFIDYEIEKLTEAGCQGVTLGKRILRVETAVTVLLSRLFL